MWAPLSQVKAWNFHSSWGAENNSGGCRIWFQGPGQVLSSQDHDSGPSSGLQRPLMKKCKTIKFWFLTGLLHERTAVAVLHFNPADGSLLPPGLHPIAGITAVPVESIRNNLPTIIRDLEVLNGAEYREPESVWVVPLAYKGMIVAHLKIYVDGIHVVPDYPASREMQLYGK